MNMHSQMSKVTQFITQVGPHLLPPAAVLFSVIGLQQRGLGYAQIGALTFVLIIFTGLLSESLKKVVELRDIATIRATVIGLLAIGLAALEVVLVHEGMVWAFTGIMTGWPLWAASVFFTMLNVFSKFGFIDGEIQEPEIESEVISLHEQMFGSANVLREVNDSFDRAA
jgi:hypothetical protein